MFFYNIKENNIFLYQGGKLSQCKKTKIGLKNTFYFKCL